MSGIVKIGQTMTMVLGIKDEENKFDMLVRNCVAHDGKRSPIQALCQIKKINLKREETRKWFEGKSGEKKERERETKKL